MAQNPMSDDQAGHQNTLVNRTIVMPTDYAYERARKAKCRALRSCSRWMQGYENLQSPLPAERIRGILALNEITLTTFARAMNMSLRPAIIWCMAARGSRQKPLFGSAMY